MLRRIPTMASIISPPTAARLVEPPDSSLNAPSACSFFTPPTVSVLWSSMSMVGDLVVLGVLQGLHLALYGLIADLPVWRVQLPSASTALLAGLAVLP